MRNVQDVLARARLALGGVSNYRLAKELAVHESMIYHLESGRKRLPDTLQIKLADIVGVDPAVIGAIAEADAATEPRMREAWKRAAARLAQALALLLCLATPFLAGPWSTVAECILPPVRRAPRRGCPRHKSRKSPKQPEPAPDATPEPPVMMIGDPPGPRRRATDKRP